MQIQCLTQNAIRNNSNPTQLDLLCLRSYYSISTALAMTYAGARGQTAKEMCQVLRVCRLKSNVHALFRATLASLNAPHGRYTLSLANGCSLTLASPSASRIAVSYPSVIRLAPACSILAATLRKQPNISINGLRQNERQDTIHRFRQ